MSHLVLAMDTEGNHRPGCRICPIFSVEIKLDVGISLETVEVFYTESLAKKSYFVMGGDTPEFSV